MDRELIAKQFGKIGARVRFAALPKRTSRFEAEDLARLIIRIPRDRDGEYFRFEAREGLEPEVAVLDVAGPDRHLLLEIREPEGNSRCLCGHDERHFFIAGVPPGVRASNVSQAKEALKPEIVLEAQRSVKSRHRHKRRAPSKNPVIRQGEWFLVPTLEIDPPDELVLRDEPVRHGQGAPHMAEYLYRTGGVTVHVSHQLHDRPEGLTEKEYRDFLIAQPGAKKWHWQVMRRDPEVYVKGRLTHRDHSTVLLKDWHRIVPNTEPALPHGTTNIAFLD